MPTGTAIDGDQQRSAGLPKGTDCGDVGAVALGDPIGNMDLNRQAEAAQVTGEEGGTGRTIDIVVAEHGHALACQNGTGKSVGGCSHIDQTVGVRHQVAQAWVEIRLCLGGTDTAPRQNSGKQLGKSIRLNHRRRVGLQGRIGAAIAPGSAKDRVGDIEERAWRVEGDRS